MFLFCLMFAMSLCASVYLCFVVTWVMRFWGLSYMRAANEKGSDQNI